MKRKRFLSIIIVSLILSLLIVGCKSNEDLDTGESDTNLDTSDSQSGEAYSKSQYIVGNGTEPSGDFRIDAWQGNAADNSVRQVIQGYETVVTDIEGEQQINDTVVKDYEIKENEDGSKTYIWKIVDDLEYSNGEKITAKDYAVEFALFGHPIITEMGGKNTYGNDFIGWNEYSKGESKTFSGVRILDDYTISVTIDPEKVPYFYELSMASLRPMHLGSWLNDDEIEVLDDGDGIYLSKDITKEEYENDINTARFAIDFPVTGPYYIKSYDESSQNIVLEINDNFKGTYDGVKPSIQTIIYKRVNAETQMDELTVGAVDLLGVAGGDEINNGFDLMEEIDIDSYTYPGSSYGRIVFSCDFGPTKDKEVRQAIAHVLDRNEFAKSFTGGYGKVIHGPYSEGFWFYEAGQEDIESNINEYPYDVDKAIELLEEAGWIYDENGNDYKEGIRYKKNDDGELEPLIIQWGSSEDNEVSDLLVISLQQNPDLEEIGMKVEQTTMDFSEMLNYVYRDGSIDDKYSTPTYHMFNMGGGLAGIYDQTKEVTTDEELINMGWNRPKIFDEELEKAANDMVYISPEEQDEFVENFVTYILRWNELLPELPLYTNEYYTFYHNRLKNYEASDHRNALAPLVYCTIE